MKKVALGLVVAGVLAILSACNNSGNNGNGTVCNAYGQCYSSNSTGACGTGAYGTGSAYGPYVNTGNGCWDTVHNISVGYQYCQGVGATSVNSGLFSPYCSSNLGYGSPFTTSTGLPFSTGIGGLGGGLGGNALLGGGVCAGAYRWIDPVTGVIQCVPMNNFGIMSAYGSPVITGTGAYFYAGVYL